MNISRIALFAALVTLSACGSGSSTAKNDSAANDSTPKAPIAAGIGGDTIDPKNASDVLFRFDKHLLNNNAAPLSAKEVREKFWPLDKDCEVDLANYVKRVFEIDSIKSSGQTDFGSEGEIVSAEVRVLNTFNVSPDMKAVAWILSYHSYEACPFSEGTCYNLSVYDKDGKLVSTRKLAEESSGADAPVSGVTHAEACLYTDFTFKGRSVDSTDNGEDITTGRYDVMHSAWKGSIDKNGKILREPITLPSTH